MGISDVQFDEGPIAIEAMQVLGAGFPDEPHDHRLLVCTTAGADPELLRFALAPYLAFELY